MGAPLAISSPRIASRPGTEEAEGGEEVTVIDAAAVGDEEIDDGEGGVCDGDGEGGAG